MPRPTLPLRPVKPIKRDDASETSASSHRRKIQVVKSEPAPSNEATPERTQPTPQLRGPTPEEVMEDPLVRSVLDVFEGEIKRVHPKNK
ncbi:MAG: hypothetical protein JKX70_04010 [Phycisphaerales bacterium]|nr:hypothetical protein [Phycisphaerales bacterium]